MTIDEANVAVEDMLSGNRFGDAGSTVVIEEFMEGEEASLLAFCRWQDRCSYDCLSRS